MSKNNNYYRKQDIGYVLYIQKGSMKTVIETVIDPSPTIFETTEECEVRFNVELNTPEDYLKYHALNQYVDQDITVGVVYGNGVELKSRFYVDSYERRFGSNKNSVVTHVFKGRKKWTNPKDNLITNERE